MLEQVWEARASYGAAHLLRNHKIGMCHTFQTTALRTYFFAPEDSFQVLAVAQPTFFVLSVRWPTPCPLPFLAPLLANCETLCSDFSDCEVLLRVPSPLCLQHERWDLNIIGLLPLLRLPVGKSGLFVGNRMHRTLFLFLLWLNTYTQNFGIIAHVLAIPRTACTQ